MSGHSELYQQHLDNVSRSFAFCIRELQEPLYSSVALAYLLCRILDTIEDSPYPDTAQKFRQLEEFNEFILRPAEPTAISAWISALPETMKPTEKKLMLDSGLMIEDLHALPKERKEILQDAVLSMSYGMAYFLKRSNSANELKLNSMPEVNRYCFFVAGVVGEMLTRLLATTTKKFASNSQNILRSHQFGLFLQKINLLKDQLEDEQVGRYLVPSQEQMWSSLGRDAQGAIDYILSIPVEERAYRLFCAWSLFLGLASVPFIKRTWLRKLLDKIPRAATEQVLASVTKRIDDNEQILELFKKMKPEDPKAELVSVAGEDFPDFKDLYRGSLSREHLSELGMVGT